MCVCVFCVCVYVECTHNQCSRFSEVAESLSTPAISNEGIHIVE